MSKTRFVFAGLCAGALCAVGATSSSAATASANMTVTATVQATCVVSANALAFGTYTGSQLDGSTTLSVTCTNTTPYTVALDAGTYSGATTSTRRLTGSVSGSSLGYQLYSNAGRTTAWGSDDGTDTVAGTGNGSAQTLNVYGRITTAQYPDPGSYSDTVVATLTY
jgi:spore coat protein U-like protein